MLDTIKILWNAYRKSGLIFQILPFLIMAYASSWQKCYDVIFCAVKWAINSETVRDIRKVTTECRLEIWVNLSESTIFKHVRQVLAAKTAVTSFPVH